MKRKNIAIKTYNYSKLVDSFIRDRIPFLILTHGIDDRYWYMGSRRYSQKISKYPDLIDYVGVSAFPMTIYMTIREEDYALVCVKHSAMPRDQSSV